MKIGTCIKFEFSKNCEDVIMVCIDKYMDYNILQEINETTKKEMQNYTGQDKFDFVDVIMYPFAKKYNFNYEILFADINIYCY